jgi:hypothetical protein
MSLQEITIKRYFDHYPKQSLREISANTDIQITRVFRLLNGAQMKLCEYEAFENAIAQKISSQHNATDDFLKTTKECLRCLSESKLNEFLIEMKQSLKVCHFQSSKPNKFIQNQLA